MSTSLDYRSFFCEEDSQFYGDEGAGALIIAKDTGRLLLFLRSDQVNEPGTWNLVGGKLDGNEDPKTAVSREIEEETGYTGDYKISLLYTFKHKDFKYSNYLMVVPFEFTPELNWEHSTSQWVEFGEWPGSLHFGIQYLFKHASHKIKKVIDLIKKKNDNMLGEEFQKTSKWRGYSGIVNRNGNIHVVYDDFNALERDHSEIGYSPLDGRWRYFIDLKVLFWNEVPSDEELEKVIQWLNYRNLKVKKILNSYTQFYNYKKQNNMLEAIDNNTPPAIIQRVNNQSLKTNNNDIIDTKKLTSAYVVVATLWGEARGEGESGMQAVMNVIMNRANGNFDKAKDIVLKPKQFSIWNGINNPEESAINLAKIQSAGGRGAKDGPMYKKAVELVDKAMKGQLTDITGGATFYFNPKKANPKWAAKMIKIKSIGNHDFYKPSI